MGGLACLTSREARLNVAGRKSKTSNTAHQGSYHVRIYIYDVSIITILLCFCYRQNTSSSTLTYKLTWSLLTSSFLPPSFSTDPLPPKLIQQSPLSPRIQDELRPDEPRDRGVHTCARRAERLLHTMYPADRLHAGRALVHRINHCVFCEYVKLFWRCV